MAAQDPTTARATIIQAPMLPDPASIAIGEVDGRLVFISSNQEHEKQTIARFTAQKGCIFKSLVIPQKYIERYSTSLQLERDSNSITRWSIRSLSLCLNYLHSMWSLASPIYDAPFSKYNLIHRQYPSVCQQSGGVSSTSRNRDKSGEIIKLEYHPLSQVMAIALKNGILFFDLRRNQWMSNSLQNENQLDISDFSFSHSGLRMAVICRHGLFLWELKPSQGSYIFRGEIITDWRRPMQKVEFSPCDKYVALYRVGGRTVEVWDVTCNVKVYRHQIFYNIRRMIWIPSTKENRFCPTRLLMATDSPYILMLNWLTFETQSFQCKKGMVAKLVCVSDRGDGMLAVTQDRYLYFISMKPFCDPQLLADLQLDFSQFTDAIDSEPENKNTDSVSSKQEQNEDDSKAESLEDIPSGNNENNQNSGDNQAVQSVQRKTYTVKGIKWSPCGRRIAVWYDERDTLSGKEQVARFVCVWAYDFSTSYRVGFITHPQEGSYPLDVTFRKHFNAGALMAISWNHGLISQHHLCFSHGSY